MDNNNLYLENFNKIKIVILFNYFNIVSNILYKIGCLLNFIISFGILLNNDYSSIILGFYLMFFNIIAGIRSLTIYFLSHFSKLSKINYNFNIFILWFDFCIFIFYILLYFYNKYIIRLKNKVILSFTQMIS